MGECTYIESTEKEVDDEKSDGKWIELLKKRRKRASERLYGWEQLDSCSDSANFLYRLKSTILK